MNKKVLAIFFAILAAGLYAINIPLSKLLLNYVEPTMMASYLYLGAGLGIGIVFLITSKKADDTSEKITKKDMPYVVGMIVLDILAPILLIYTPPRRCSRSVTDSYSVFRLCSPRPSHLLRRRLWLLCLPSSALSWATAS